MCNTTFGPSIQASIVSNLRTAPNFRVLVASRELVPPPDFMVKMAEVPVEYSWIARGAAYVYVRDGLDHAPHILAHRYCRDGVCALPRHLWADDGARRLLAQRLHPPAGPEPMW